MARRFGLPHSREGNVGAPCDVRLTSRVAEYNDLDGLAPRWRPHWTVAPVWTWWTLSSAAARATLTEVLTAEAFAGMVAVADRFAAGVRSIVDSHRLPWSVSRLGARVEYRFADPAPRTGGEAAAAADPELEDYLHVYLANRGVLLTPFHNMSLMSPATTDGDVDRHRVVLDAAVAELGDR
ncbi:hypothetical protein Val02_80970 [Virgisporangium aliadipatigenens]|uniref:Glutamate-1-semialdehyde 2,1-aminomutase n=1 Tax=Virgisporangium aliadipatigenens TaxID=741659 RepID=A0A8J3YTF4_9ACTN|nr:hypothetical protein [Virgisporangium aliadipatigenens]GIJ51211.1 hypothetical protein Val02_80970 [Virgisporangium aliadipatigenens]